MKKLDGSLQKYLKEKKERARRRKELKIKQSHLKGSFGDYEDTVV